MMMMLTDRTVGPGDKEMSDSGVNISQESMVTSRTELMVASWRRTNDVVSAELDVAGSVALSVRQTSPTVDCGSKAGKLPPDERRRETPPPPPPAKRNERNSAIATTRADVLCQVQTRARSSAVERPPTNDDDFAIDFGKEKSLAAVSDGRCQTQPSWNSASSYYSDERTTTTATSLFGGGGASKDDDSLSCADRQPSCVEDLFTRRKPSSEEEHDDEQQQQIADVIQVRRDSDRSSCGDDADATVAKQPADRFVVPTGASIPMGQGGHVHPIFMKGDIYGNVLPIF